MYSKYAYGVPDASNSVYNFILTHDNSDAGFELRNDITKTEVGNKGVRINHSLSNNSSIDLRSSTGAVNSFSFRLQDDAAPSSFSDMMVLTDDNKSSASAYGVKVGGRMKASQYFIGENDTRTPSTPGLYIGQDTNSGAYFNMNYGSGEGGFKFSTYDSTGNTKTSNLELDRFGYAKMPYYSATNNVLDTESSSAIVTFDSTGKLIRDYQQNARLRSSESRAGTLESTVLPSISGKVNEIISRMNAVAFFNSNISNMVLGQTPVAYTPPAASVSLNMNVDLTTANDPTFQQSLITSTATTLDVNQSQVSIGSITTGTGASGGRFTVGSGVNIEMIIAPDPTGVKKVNPQVAVQTLAAQAQSATSPFITTLKQARGGVNPVNTSYVPVTKVVTNITPAPTTPAPTTPAPTTPAPTTPAPTTPAPTTPAPTTPAPTTPAPTTPAPTSAPVNARYIKLRYGNAGSDNRLMNLSGIKVYTSEGYNVVKPTTATSASSLYSSGFPASNMVDNAEQTIWHSYFETNPWFQLDLGSDMPIYKIEIVNRPGITERANGTVIECINNSNTSVFTSNMFTNQSGSVVYAEANNGYNFFTCWPSKGTTVYGTIDNPSYVNDPNVVTVQNYTGNESIIDIYGAPAAYSWVAPVACKLLSVSYYVSGAINNGGFASGSISTGSSYYDIGGHTFPTTVGPLPFYELVNAWNIPVINAGETISFSFSTLEAYRYLKALQLPGNQIAVKFSYIPISNIITPAPPTEPPAIVATNYVLKWIISGGKFALDTNVTTPTGNIKNTTNPDSYTLPAGTYNFTVQGINDSNDWVNVTFYNEYSNSTVATLATGWTPWGAKGPNSGSFTLPTQTTFTIRYSNQFYAYNTYVQVNLTRQ